MRRRSEAIQRAANTSYDLCVIGGGASGAGCALDAQLRGLNTLLVDAGDFASGTSSASTKLIHGGLRYLEQAVLEFDVRQYRVVRLALNERQIMMRNAPHLTQTRRFVVPCFSFLNALYCRIGVKLYDWFASDAALGGSSSLGRAKSLARMPWLNAHGLVATVLYSDGQFDDARYNLALVQSCAAAGGEVLNYAAVKHFEFDGNGRIVAAIADDRESGRSLSIAARAFVNATGPFSDRIRRIATPSATPRLRVSKGAHILLPLPESFKDHALLIPSTEDGRVIFAIPWLGRLLVGTTETESSVDAPMLVTRDEAEYLLRYLNRYVAQPLRLADIVGSFAGLRPLVQPRHPRASKKIARDFEVEHDRASGLISLLGGKWTVYRAMAECAVDEVERQLAGRVTQCRTREHRLFGSENPSEPLLQMLCDRYSVSLATIRHLVLKFGSRTCEILEMARGDRGLLSPLVPGAAHICAEVVYCARKEMIVSLEDLLKRRLGLQYFDWQIAMEAAPIAARLLARELGWTMTRTRTEIETYIERITNLQEQIIGGPLREKTHGRA